MHRRIQMMKCMMHVQPLAPAELKALVDHLQQHGQQPLDPAAYLDMETPAGQAFRSTCTQCYALREPRQHTARE